MFPFSRFRWVAFWALCAVLVGGWVIQVLPHAASRGSLLSIVAGESLLVVGLAALAAWLWPRKPWVFLLFVPLGMALGAAAHGLAFFSDGSPDPGMALGFGLVSAVVIGLPLGLVMLGGVWLAWWLGGRNTLRQDRDEV